MTQAKRIPSIAQSLLAVVKYILQHPGNNHILVEVKGDLEFDLQIHYENEDTVGRNMRRALREFAVENQLPITFGSFTQSGNVLGQRYDIHNYF